jgi:hypothetical protein
MEDEKLHDNNEKGDQASAKAANDDFDLEKLRLGQDFEKEIAVKKLIVTVPVRKPNRQEFIRVRPSEEWRLQTCLLTLKEDGRGETYLVDPGLWQDLSVEIVPTILFTAISRQGVLMLWPIRLPGGDGRTDHWSASALEAATLGESRWVRVSANMSLGAYEPFVAQGDIPQPEWPEISFGEIVRIAFKERFVKDLNHPAVRRLRGLQ